MPWNNIYTTNYDNLLEKSVDITIGAELKTKIELLQDEITSGTKELQEKQHLLLAVNDEISLLEDRIKISSLSKALFPSDPGPSVDEDQLKTLIEKRTKLNHELYFLESHALKNKSDRLAALERNYNLINSVVTYSSELAIKKNGNIIKIHGSIRTADSKEYGFDSDARKQYVISKEDYETYPAKHEAFTQLMRISLLQESFCLLGFSGIDPNFLSWIGWVRDVIQRKKIDNSDFSDKIYLVDINAEPADQEKSLFHHNHRIAFVPLAHPECVEFLQNATGRILPTTPKHKDYMELFLDYLSIGTIPNKLKIAFEVFQHDEYNELWKKASWSHDDQTAQDNLSIFSKSKEIVRLKKYNRFPSDLYNNDDKYHFLTSFETYLEMFKNDNDKLGDLLQIAKILIDEQFQPHSIIFSETPLLFGRLATLAKELNHETYPRFLLTDLKDAVWINDKLRVTELIGKLEKEKELSIINEFQYLKALHSMFNFDFTNAQKILYNWKPVEVWILKKAGLVSISSPAEAVKILKQEQQSTVQENLYQLELLAYISLSANGFSERTNYNQQIKAIIHEGLKPHDHNIDLIIERLNRKEKKIVPYGYDKFIISNTITFGGSNEVINSIILFNLLIEGGFPLDIPRTYYKKFEEVHPAFDYAYSFIPFPVLFFIFQYPDEKFVLKMAQDYAFNDTFQKEVAIIFDNIQVLYFDEKAPQQFRRNGLIFLSELINVLQPGTWQPFFIRVWNIQKEKKELFAERRVSKNYFIEKGLHYIIDPEIVAQVINDCLMAIIVKDEDFDQRTVIQYLYEINFNKVVKKQGSSIGAKLNKDAIKTIVDTIPTTLDLLFIIGNVFFTLNKKQQDYIHRILTEIKDFNTDSERIWRIFLSLAKGDFYIISKIKSEILKSSKLWDAGFTSTGGLSNSNAYISLYSLRKFKNNYGIVWEQDELIIIYHKMIDTLTKIEDWTKSHTPFSLAEFKRIAEEMSWFLSYEKERLQRIIGFALIIERVEKLFVKEKQYQEIIQGLLSHEKNEFTSALNEVSYQIYNYHKFKEHRFHIQTIINKLLLKTEPGLAEAFGTLSDWLLEFRKEKVLKQYQYMFEELLLTYSKNSPENIDLPFLEENMIKVAFILKLWGSNNEIIFKYLALLENSRFNDIRQNLKLKLQDITN